MMLNHVAVSVQDQHQHCLCGVPTIASCVYPIGKATDIVVNFDQNLLRVRFRSKIAACGYDGTLY